MHKINIYTGRAETDEIERLISLAREVGSSDLGIKARTAKSLALLLSGDMVALKAEVISIEKTEEFKNFPELRLELSVIKSVMEQACGNEREALKILKKTLSECFLRDLALIIAELRAAGTAYNMISSVPEKTIIKIEQYISRPVPEMDKEAAEKYGAFQKRIAEFYKTAAEAAKNRQGNPFRAAETRA